METIVEKNKKQLGLVIPPPVYYSLFAADKLSMLCMNETGMNWIHNNFIQMLFYKEFLDDPGLFGDHFYRSQYMTIWPIDTFKIGNRGANLLLDEYPVDDHFWDLTPDTLIDAVIRWIDKDLYVYANIDVSKLSTTHYYGPTPFCHSSMVVGYDKDAGVLKQVDYAQNGAINLLDIPYQDYIDAFFSPDLERILKEEKKRDVRYSITLHRVKKNVKVALNPETMKYWLKEFIDCQQTNKKMDHFIELGDTLGGFDVYKGVLDMSNLLFEVNKGNIDYRMYHCIYEHKHLMQQRIQALEDNGFLSAELGLRAMNEKLLKLAESMRFTILKNNLAPRKANVELVTKKMNQLVDQERELMDLLYHNL